MQTLEQWIEASGLFVTDLEQITDILLEAEQIFLYDTAAISLHEIAFRKYGKILFKYVQRGTHPVVITDTIAKEMRLLEDTDQLYATYLQQFQPLLFIPEVDFFSLLTAEYNIQGARTKFQAASEKAFAVFQSLREQLSGFRESDLTGVETRIFDAYHTLFAANKDDNKGEMSLLWLSCILDHIAPNVRVTFVGIDKDLYQHVTRCYFQSPYEPSKRKPREITLVSTDTLLQATHLLPPNERTGFDLNLYIDLYRNPTRYVHFFERSSGIRSHQIQRRQFTNEDFEASVRAHGIDIVY